MTDTPSALAEDDPVTVCDNCRSLGMTGTPSSLADQTIFGWAEAASENPVLKARVRELETALHDVRAALLDDRPIVFLLDIISAALQPKEPK